jgi:alcohol dehydrogenase class IV
LAHAIRFNGDAAGVGLQKVGAALGLPSLEGDALIEAVVLAIEELFGKLGVPRRLRDVGVTRDALPSIASSAIDDWFLRGNPRPVKDATELQHILEAAW